MRFAGQGFGGWRVAVLVDIIPGAQGMMVGHHMGIVHTTRIRFRFQALTIDEDIFVIEAIRLAVDVDQLVLDYIRV